MFVNFSNHPSAKWSVKQLNEAAKYGAIVDISFPVINNMLTDDDIYNIADMYAQEIRNLKPDVVMCQGEFTVAHRVVNELMSSGIKVVSACSERVVTEKVLPDGNVEKTAVFIFEKFREYK
ncbi:MAG: hypothetical protein MJ119_02225 [Lachnospiraceae bacterium]|nr:hypothetical protein [Lachnospiraceae bacterium]